MALIDNGVYVAGRRVETPASLDETYELMRKHGGLAWIGLYRPSEHELESVAAEFDLHPLAVEDALTGHQRSKVERYGDTLFVVLRPAHYRDVEESVEFGELHVFVGPDFVMTIRHAESADLGAVRRRMEHNPELLAMGPEACCMPCSMRSSTSTSPLSRAWRTTSTRSRISCSATATMTRCPDASMSSRGRSSTFSARSSHWLASSSSCSAAP